MPEISGIRKFFFKLRNWEYWPFSVIYLPVFFYYGWLILKAKSFFFFTASNPSIEFGGMLGEKKSDIFPLLPDKYIPITKLIKKGEGKRSTIEGRKIGYPLIAKPDVGERGAWVRKIDTENDLIAYTDSCPVDFLLQEFVDYPIELGVFFVRLPSKEGYVTSIVRKEFLEVTGDGKSSVMELLSNSPRAVLTADFSCALLKKEGDSILGKNERLLIEPIGNHCKGTKFLSNQHEIDATLSKAINLLASQIPDFYFGRFDLKCKSIEDIKSLKNFKILELNGAGAEPGHIYQPGYSLIRAYKDICWHLSVLADISIQNHKRGVEYWSFKRGYKKWMQHRKHNQLLSHS